MRRPDFQTVFYITAGQSKHDTKHPLVMRIRLCANEGSRPFARYMTKLIQTWSRAFDIVFNWRITSISKVGYLQKILGCHEFNNFLQNCAYRSDVISMQNQLPAVPSVLWLLQFVNRLYFKIKTCSLQRTVAQVSEITHVYIIARHHCRWRVSQFGPLHRIIRIEQYISLIRWRHQSRWTAFARHLRLYSREGSLSCHPSRETEIRFPRSQPTFSTKGFFMVPHLL